MFRWLSMNYPSYFPAICIQFPALFYISAIAFSFFCHCTQTHFKNNCVFIIFFFFSVLCWFFSYGKMALHDLNHYLMLDQIILIL